MLCGPVRRHNKSGTYVIPKLHETIPYVFVYLIAMAMLEHRAIFGLVVDLGSIWHFVVGHLSPFLAKLNDHKITALIWVAEASAAYVFVLNTNAVATLVTKPHVEFAIELWESAT